MANTELQIVVRACRGPLLLVVVFSASINVLALASPIYMLQLYDRVLASRSIDTLVWVTLIVVAALAVLSLLEALRRTMLASLATWLEERLAPAVMRSAVSIAANNSSLAAIASSDLAVVRNFFVGPAITPLFDAPWSPLFILVLFIVHPLLGFIGVGAAIGLLSLAVANEALTRSSNRLVGGATLRRQQLASAVVQNADVVTSMGMLDGVSHFAQDTGAFAKSMQATAERRGTLLLSVSKFARLAVQTAIMGVGAWLVIQDNASAGVIFASSFLLSRALAPIDNAIGTWKSLVTARSAYLRLGRLLSEAPAKPSGMALPVPHGSLQVENLVFVPPGCTSPSLRGVSFQLHGGDVLAVVGPSAAGKSTLARLIAGSCAPSQGRIRLDGADLSVWHQSGGACHFGYLPQDVELFEGTVRQNIARFSDADPSDVIEAAQVVGLHETIMGLPDGYDSQIGSGGVRLSGGLRQRVGLARAVFGRPRLVILDEPNASLDHDGEQELHRTIEMLKADRATVIIVTHRPTILNLADKLLLLRNGVVDAFGSKDAVIAQVAEAHQSVQRNAAIGRDDRSTTTGGPANAY